MAGRNFEEILQHLNVNKNKKILELVECDSWLFVCAKACLSGLECL